MLNGKRVLNYKSKFRKHTKPDFDLAAASCHAKRTEKKHSVCHLLAKSPHICTKTFFLLVLCANVSGVLHMIFTVAPKCYALKGFKENMTWITLKKNS